MDSKKVFFLVLALIAVLYFASLGTGIAINKRDNGGQPADPAEAEHPLADALGPALARFAPSIDLSGPEAECNGQRVDRVFKLQVPERGTAKCEVGIPKDPDRRYGKTGIRRIGSSPIPFYKYARLNKCDEREGKRRVLDKLWFEVRYEPGADSQALDCWTPQRKHPQDCWQPEEPVAITTLQDGGKLTLCLQCNNCKRGPHILRLKME